MQSVLLVIQINEVLAASCTLQPNLRKTPSGGRMMAMRMSMQFAGPSDMVLRSERQEARCGSDPVGRSLFFLPFPALLCLAYMCKQTNSTDTAIYAQQLRERNSLVSLQLQLQSRYRAIATSHQKLRRVVFEAL